MTPGPGSAHSRWATPRLRESVGTWGRFGGFGGPLGGLFVQGPSPEVIDPATSVSVAPNPASPADRGEKLDSLLGGVLLHQPGELSDVRSTIGVQTVPHVLPESQDVSPRARATCSKYRVGIRRSSHSDCLTISNPLKLPERRVQDGAPLAERLSDREKFWQSVSAEGRFADPPRTRGVGSILRGHFVSAAVGYRLERGISDPFLPERTQEGHDFIARAEETPGRLPGSDQHRVSEPGADLVAFAALEGSGKPFNPEDQHDGTRGLPHEPPRGTSHLAPDRKLGHNGSEGRRRGLSW